MKIRELQNIRTKGIDDLKKDLKEKKLTLIKVRSEIKIGREKNLKKAKNLGKDIAQVSTIIKEKEIMQIESEKSKPDKNS